MHPALAVLPRSGYLQLLYAPEVQHALAVLPHSLMHPALAVLPRSCFSIPAVSTNLASTSLTKNMTANNKAVKRGAASIHRESEKAHSRKLSFRCREFSETQFVALHILRNLICRGNPMHSGPDLCTNR